MPYTVTLDRDDGTEVSVEYTITGGCPAHYGSLTYPGHPAEAPEVEIIRALDADEEIAWSAEEENRWYQWIIENHDEDDGPDPDAERERTIEDREFFANQPFED